MVIKFKTKRAAKAFAQNLSPRTGDTVREILEQIRANKGVFWTRGDSSFYEEAVSNAISECAAEPREYEMKS